MWTQTATRHYDFAEQLTWSDGYLNEGIERILINRLPGVYKVEKASSQDDREGTDYWGHRAHDLPPLSVDVKVRKEDYAKRGYDDLALETWSVTYSRIGWTRDESKRTDYVLWYWTDTGRFFLVAFPALCAVFRRYWQQWSSEYKKAPQDSGGWKSECVFVPRKVVIDKLAAWSSGSVA